MKGIRVLMTVVLTLVLAEVTLVAFVTFSEDARGAVTDAWAKTVNAWAGSEERAGNFELLLSSADEFAAEWVQPLWSAPEAAPAGTGFSECVTCHTDYAERRLFTGVFMNHPLHSELGIACAECHTDVAHPLPLPPAEETCAGCHNQVERDGPASDCSYCHKPGSLAHYQSLGVPDGAANCSTCHLPDSFGHTDQHALTVTPSFDGTDSAVCLNCHQAAACARCHDSSHPADWVSLHGAEVQDAGTGAGSCAACHSTNWCAGACHLSGTLQGGRLLPLPIGDDD